MSCQSSCTFAERMQGGAILASRWNLFSILNSAGLQIELMKCLILFACEGAQTMSYTKLWKMALLA